MMPPQEGLRAQARVKMSQGVKFLIDALGMLKEVGSEEGRALVSALKTLAPVVPDITEGVGQSEVAALLASAQAVRPQAPGGAPTMLGTPRPTPNVIAGAGGGMGMGR